MTVWVLNRNGWFRFAAFVSFGVNTTAVDWSSSNAFAALPCFVPFYLVAFGLLYSAFFSL